MDSSSPYNYILHQRYLDGTFALPSNRIQLEQGRPGKLRRHNSILSVHGYCEPSPRCLHCISPNADVVGPANKTWKKGCLILYLWRWLFVSSNCAREGANANLATLLT